MAAGTLRPLPKHDFDYARARHLLNRAGFGGSPSQVQALADMGLDDAVDSLVDGTDAAAAPVEADAFDCNIMRPLSEQEQRSVRRARRDGDEATLEQYRRRRQEAQRADRRQMREIQQWWLVRMIETPRPLQEKMTLFWHGHFATSYRAIEDSYHMFVQNQMLRRHATGNFGALVHAVVRDPAMLRYLNNDQNRRREPNENLARELMELFTLGEGNEYTELDIKEGARALTGYGFEDDAFTGPGSPRYRRQHDDGVKRILGKTGNWDGDDFVDIILAHRSCADFICWKLYRYFVNDLPGVPDHQRQRYIGDLAAKLRRSRYRLDVALKSLFRSEHFYDPTNVGAQIKSPVQLIVQAVRTLGVPPRDPTTLLTACELMGQNLFFPPSVKGWDGGRSWINTSTLFVRQDVLVYLLTGRGAGRGFGDDNGGLCDLTSLVEHLGPDRARTDAREVVTYLLRVNLAAEPHPQRIDSLVEFVESRKRAIDNDMLVGVVCLIGGMPEYQLC